MLFFPLLLAVVAWASLVDSGSVSVPNSRIVGGLPANIVDIPYIVSLITYGFHSCGGSIVNEQTVITAAHCLAFTTPHLLKVHVGAKTRALTEGQLIAVKAIHSHQLWTLETMDYDLGLVRLAKTLTYSATVQPIQLPQPKDVLLQGSLATVAGWGYLSSNGPGAEELHYARVPIMNQKSCNRTLQGLVTDRMICAGYLKGGIDACQMDSGGPLIAQKKLIGIVSWGIGCALPNKPGVYTRVSVLMPWVTKLMAGEYNESI